MVCLVRCYDLDPDGGSDAHFGFGDFDGGHGFDSCSGRSPDLWRELSVLPAILRHGRRVRYRLLLWLDGAVPGDSIGSLRHVPHESILFEYASAPATIPSAASSRLLSPTRTFVRSSKFSVRLAFTATDGGGRDCGRCLVRETGSRRWRYLILQRPGSPTKARRRYQGFPAPIGRPASARRH